MKYNLVNAVDGKIYLGYPQDIFDEDGDPIKDKAIENKKFNQLTNHQKQLPIAYLGAKSNRDKAGELFFPKNLKTKPASELKNNIKLYRDFVINLLDSNESLISEISMVCDVSNKGSGKKLQLWEEYNFVDMPAVGALTILSKIQSDLLNIESDVINYLKRNI